MTLQSSYPQTVLIVLCRPLPISSVESHVVSLAISWHKIHTTSLLVLINCCLNGISCLGTCKKKKHTHTMIVRKL